MEACALSLDSRGDCLMGVKWQGERERRAGEKGDGTGWDGMGKKEGRN